MYFCIKMQCHFDMIFKEIKIMTFSGPRNYYIMDQLVSSL